MSHGSLAWFGFMVLNTIIFQLYRGSQFYWWRKPEDPEKSTDLSQVTEILLKVALNTMKPTNQSFLALPSTSVNTSNISYFHTRILKLKKRS